MKLITCRHFLLITVIVIFSAVNVMGVIPSDQKNEGIRVSVFNIDVTPPEGNFLAYESVKGSYEMGLRARGVVILGSGKPIVLCSFDWIGIGNDGHKTFCNEIAKAAGTTPERVALHTVHQHDTPVCDFGAEKILKDAGLDPGKYEGSFQREVIRRLAAAVRNSLQNQSAVTHLGYGEAEVKQVASNRRIIKNGSILPPRLSACWDSALRAEPEGLIDPNVQLISFWNGKVPVAVLSYYAVHPQSYYRTGIPNPDFPGIARFMRQLAVPQALHIHFNGAGGNITAGKYNNGALENRGILAQRLADGMKKAWESTEIVPLSPDQLRWTFEPVSLPPAKDLFTLLDKKLPPDSLLVRSNAFRLAWLRRNLSGDKININCLSLGKIRILHLPGEAFIEYQVAAKAERKDLKVAVAAYGDYGPGYIGTDIAYKQGGYETSYVSKVAPGSEKVLMTAIKKLLKEN